MSSIGFFKPLFYTLKKMIITFEHVVIHDSNCSNDSAVRQDMKSNQQTITVIFNWVTKVENQFNADT